LHITTGKLISLVIAAAYIACAIVSQGLYGLKCVMAVFIPLLLIWFPDEIGNATNYFAGHSLRVDAETPPIVISIMGWLFLVGFPVLLYFFWK
jgi:hypothetical protein